MSKLFGIRVQANGDIIRAGVDGRLQVVATPLDFGLDRWKVVLRAQTTLLPRRPLPGNLPLSKVVGHTTSGYSITVADIEMVWNDRRFVNTVYSPHDVYAKWMNDETREVLALADRLYTDMARFETVVPVAISARVTGRPEEVTQEITRR